MVIVGAEISGARFHRAEHVKNVLHVRATTVILALVLVIGDSADVTARLPDRRAVNGDDRSLTQQSQRTLQQLVLLSMDRVKAQLLDVVNGRSQPERLADRERSRFKFGGQFAPG